MIRVRRQSNGRWRSSFGVPQPWRKSAREVNEVMKGSPKDAAEESDIGRMPFLQTVVKETLRLHPPATLLVPRRASETVQVTTEEKGKVSLYTIPEDTRILVNAWAIGRDPSIWGSDADMFRPERFTGSEFCDIDYKGRHMELIPFGAGRRMCPALLLASRMVHLILANLIWSFDWNLPEGSTPADISMTEKFGLSLSKAEPILVYPVISGKITG